MGLGHGHHNSAYAKQCVDKAKLENSRLGLIKAIQEDCRNFVIILATSSSILCGTLFSVFMNELKCGTLFSAFMNEHSSFK